MFNSSSSPIVSSPYWSFNKCLRIVILISIVCLTLIGNFYIIFELIIRRRRRRPRLHFFLFHLAIGDLTICFCTMTSELFLIIHDQEWTLGNVACKLTLYIQVVTIASTTFINVALTYDRYEAICWPLRACQSLSRIHRIIFLCWLSSFLVAIPQLFIFEQSSIPQQLGRFRCASTGYTAEWQRRVYFTIFASYVLFIPVLCMTFWYVRIIRMINKSTKVWTQNYHHHHTLTTIPLTSPTKIRTVKLAMTIIIVFIVCWTPYMIITLIEIYSNGRFRAPSWLDGTLQTLCLCQSGLNPLIYLVVNQQKKYSPTLILAAASTCLLKHDRKERRLRRERGGSIPFYSIPSQFDGRTRKEELYLEKFS